MKYTAEAILKPLGRFAGGITPLHNKGTANSQSVIMPPPNFVKIPLKQHIGSALEPCVAVGDTVCVGTKIGDCENNFSAPIHSSVSGKVTAIEQVTLPSGETVKSIVIESDSHMTEENFTPPNINNAQDIVDAARQCGLVGLGGAGFPAHIKLAPAADEKIDTLIVNAAECEPYITSDYRTCMENFQDVIDGVYLLRDIFNFKKVIIAVESNKPLAIRKLYEIATDRRDTEDTVKLMRLKTHYPQGAEKMLIYSVTKRKIPFGKLPADVGCLVMNVTSIAVLHNYIRTGRPLTSKCITVDGDGVKEPKNVIVPVGTSIADLLEFCGGVHDNVSKILYGGPMMGIAVTDTSSVITKQNNAVLAFVQKEPMKTTPCIRCGKCVGACPIKLLPSAVESAVTRQNTEILKNLNVNHCIECGCCSFVCPAGRPLTQSMRTAKGILRRERNA